MNIFHRETLDYYDCVLLFEAEDETGRKYVAVHDDDYQTGCEYIVTPVPQQSLTAFKAGRIDLRRLMAASPDGQWYMTKVGVETRSIALVPGDGPVVTSGNLPDEGYYMTPTSMDRRAQRFAVASNRPAMTVRAGGTEELEAHEMHLSMFNAMARRFVDGVRSLVQEEHHEAPKAQYEMKLIGSPAPGSMEILLAAPMRGNWFEPDYIVSAMDEWTKMMDASFNENNVEMVIQSHGTQSLQQLRLIANWLRRNGVYLDIEWSAGINGSSGAVLVNSERAGDVADKLKAVSNVSTTTVELAGMLDGISLSKGTWTILTDDGPRTGKSRSSTLEGMTTGRYYVLTCEQTVDEMSNNPRPRFWAVEIVEI